jgi:cytoplasmic iron level regulating protein YaaA (DUF328/UPF0246 family)
MLVVVSPAKKLDFERPSLTEKFSEPQFLSKSSQLVKELKKLTSTDLEKLMKISPKLAELNTTRFRTFKTPFTPENAKQAAYAFRGDTYVGLDFDSFQPAQVNYAQNHLRILSGLYGVLRPLDLIQPYRLEMGTKFKIKDCKNLYEWWKQDITSYLNKELKKEKILVNCASKEYFSSIDTSSLDGQLINVHFLEMKAGVAKVNSLFAKRARGMMGQYILKNKLKTVEELKNFNEAGYQYDKERSEGNDLVFVR